MMANVVFLWFAVCGLLFYEVALDFMVFSLAEDVKQNGNVQDALLLADVVSIVSIKLAIAYVINEIRTVIEWHNIIGTLLLVVLLVTVLDVCLFVNWCFIYKGGARNEHIVNK